MNVQPNFKREIINLGNSIVGVSILSIPYCMQKCGLILGLLLLLLNAWLTNVTCNMLMRSCVLAHTFSYEALAYRAFGFVGKISVELCIICQLMGTCIAFHVIIGDLGPAIVSQLLKIENTWELRLSIMLFLAVFVTFPLSLNRRMDGLASYSAASMLFYFFLCATIVMYSVNNFFNMDWIRMDVLFNPSGVFSCFAIIALSYACQTQLFVLYDSLADPSVSDMEVITRKSVTMTTILYMLIGFFGYLAFSGGKGVIHGDMLLHFPSSLLGDFLKILFVLSIAISFPLCILPCRESFYTLVFGNRLLEHNHSLPDSVRGSRIPEPAFSIITTLIVLVTLVAGILVPNVAFVLSLTGAIGGSLICYVLPCAIFISVSSRSDGSTSSVRLAKFVVVLGVCILVISTAATLMLSDVEDTTVQSDVHSSHLAATLASFSRGVEDHDVKNDNFQIPTVKNYTLNSNGSKNHAAAVNVEETVLGVAIDKQDGELRRIFNRKHRDADEVSLDGKKALGKKIGSIQETDGKVSDELKGHLQFKVKDKEGLKERQDVGEPELLDQVRDGGRDLSNQNLKIGRELNAKNQREDNLSENDALMKEKHPSKYMKVGVYGGDLSRLGFAEEEIVVDGGIVRNDERKERKIRDVANNLSTLSVISDEVDGVVEEKKILFPKGEEKVSLESPSFVQKGYVNDGKVNAPYLATTSDISNGISDGLYNEAFNRSTG